MKKTRSKEVKQYPQPPISTEKKDWPSIAPNLLSQIIRIKEFLIVPLFNNVSHNGRLNPSSKIMTDWMEVEKNVTSGFKWVMTCHISII